MQPHPLLAGAAALVLTAFAPAPAAHAQGSAPGYADALLPNPAPFSSRATLSDGRVVDFDGQIVSLTSADGVVTTQLHDFGVANFSGIVKPSLDETFAIVGETSNGDLFSVDLALGGATYVATVPFNYDAVWESPTSLLISAGAPSFNDNNIVRLNVTTGAQTLLVAVTGPSGPIGIDGFGNLYTVILKDADVPGDTANVVLFPAFALTGSPVLTDFDASPLGIGFEAASSMHVTPNGRVYITENQFGLSGRIWAVNGSPLSSELLYEGAGEWVTFDRVDAGSGPGVFAAFQPELGSGRFLCNRTDFGTFEERFDFTPKRPAMSVTTGPVGVGVGFTLDVTDGRPNSPVVLAYGATPAPGTPEIGVIPSPIPLLSSFDLNSLQIFPFPLLLDGNGEFSVSFATGAISGVSFQGLMLDDNFIGIATTTRADL
jgi:hypothetical protein